MPITPNNKNNLYPCQSQSFPAITTEIEQGAVSAATTETSQREKNLQRAYLRHRTPSTMI